VRVRYQVVKVKAIVLEAEERAIRLGRIGLQSVARKLEERNMVDPYPTGVSMTTNYKGKLLVATPVLNGNVVFAQSVVYIYDDKSLEKNPQQRQVSGVILNKPSQFKISSLGSLKDIPFDPSLEMKFVHKGGPVSDTSVVLLHTNEWVSTNTLKANNDLSITSDLLMIEKLATGNEPKGWRMFAGMSVWTPEQLDMEVNNQHAWLVCDPAPNCVFDYDQEEQWLKALELCSSQILSNYI